MLHPGWILIMTDAMDWSDLASQAPPSFISYSGFERNGHAAQGVASLSAAAAAPQPLLPRPTLPTEFAAAPGQESQSFLDVSQFKVPARLTEGSTQLHGDSWDERVAEHERAIMDRIIERAESKTRKQIDDRFEQRMQKAWKRDREKWIKNILGTSSSSSTSPLRVQQLLEDPGRSSEQRLALPYQLDTSTPVLQRRSYPGALTKRLESSIVREHLDIIASSSDLAVAAAKLGTTTLPPGDLSSAYHLIWQYTEELLKMKIESPSPVEQAVAYLAFLCKQTQAYIINRVRAASLAGNSLVASAGSHFQNSMASTCAAFAKLVVGESSTSNLWPVAYFCLRCGDAVAASEVLIVMGMHHSDQPAVMHLVNAMASAQGKRACLWEGVEARLDANDRQRVAAMLDSARNQEHRDVYQVGFLTLCCASDILPSSENTFGFSSVEDYMCGALWKALFSSRTHEEIMSFGETISEFGLDYFGENLVPFFVAQQYETLLMYLAKISGEVGLCYAAHVGLILSSSGIPLCNTNRRVADKPTDLDASLIVAYSDMLLTDSSFGVPAALVYLAKIPSKVRACQEVAALIAKTGRTDQLVGSLDADGFRTGPALLDKHFSAEEITEILSLAASQLLRDKSDRNKMSTAVLCLSLAGKYADALALMGNLLSPPDEPDPLRSHWMSHAETFFNNFLSKRTHVVDVLEKENKTMSISTFRKMIDLNRFFQLHRDRKLVEAAKVLEQLDLLPVNKHDMSSKASLFSQRDALLKKAMPAVILTAVEILHAEYKQTSRSSQHWSPSKSVSEARLRELKEQIQAIATYTSITGVALSHEQLSALNRIASGLPRLKIRQLARLLASGALTSEQLCSYCYTLALAGDEIWNLGAFSHLLPKEQVLEQARVSDARRNQSGPKSLLDGIPVTVKANIAVEFLPLTAGSRILGAHCVDKMPAANYNSDVVESLLGFGGAVCLGSTTMDEFGMGSLGTNVVNVNGKIATKNPTLFLQKIGKRDMSDEEVIRVLHLESVAILDAHDAATNVGLTYSAGGSSCGSAASVAHGSCIASLGTDTGGSVRLPAAWCNIVGLKPTYGLLSRHGLVSYASSLDCPGIMTPSSDCASIVLDCLLQTSISDCDSTMDRSLKRKSMLEHVVHESLTPAYESKPLDGVTIGIPAAFSIKECSKEVLDAWDQTACQLETLGASIEVIGTHDMSADVVRQALSAYYVLACAEASSNLARYDGLRYGVAANLAEVTDELARELQLSALEHQYIATRSNGFGREVARRILSGTAVLSSDRFHTYYEAAAKLRSILIRQLHTSLESFDMLLVPTAIFPPVSLDNCADSTEMLANDIMTVPASLAGLPSISVCPTNKGFAEFIFAPGMQLIGSRFGEATLLRAAIALESNM
ncbi:hypothetical protein MPSEU_000502400 [Mayamaea pseudoterrestris]|nr:hypothetical protein MPSEU_000502400 [Mayamaea pseudoterrestris]